MAFRIFLSPPHMGGKEQQYVNEAFESNWIAPYGPQINAFEKETNCYLKGRNMPGDRSPVLLKGYQSKTQKYVMVYSVDKFGVFTFVGFIDIYTKYGQPVRERLKPFLELA